MEGIVALFLLVGVAVLSIPITILFIYVVTIPFSYISPNMGYHNQSIFWRESVEKETIQFRNREYKVGYTVLTHKINGVRYKKTPMQEFYSFDGYENKR